MPEGRRYSLDEIERRWLVATPPAGSHGEARVRHIVDRYILTTRLRLRQVLESGQEPLYKLAKKYEPDDTGVQRVVSIYLSKHEYELLASLPAAVAKKKRVAVAGGSLDEYESPHTGLQIFEVEFPSSALAARYEPPAFVGQEITGNVAFTGFALASA